MYEYFCNYRTGNMVGAKAEEANISSSSICFFSLVVAGASYRRTSCSVRPLQRHDSPAHRVHYPRSAVVPRRGQRPRGQGRLQMSADKHDTGEPILGIEGTCCSATTHTPGRAGYSVPTANLLHVCLRCSDAEIFGLQLLYIFSSSFSH